MTLSLLHKLLAKRLPVFVIEFSGSQWIGLTSHGLGRPIHALSQPGNIGQFSGALDL